MLSDFFDEDGCAAAVKMLRASGHDLILVHVNSPEECRPSLFGELLLEDAETGETLRVESSPQSSAAYEQAFREFCNRLQHLAAQHGGRYARAVTDVPYQEFVLRSLRNGRVLA